MNGSNIASFTKESKSTIGEQHHDQECSFVVCIKIPCSIDADDLANQVNTMSNVTDVDLNWDWVDTWAISSRVKGLRLPEYPKIPSNSSQERRSSSKSSHQNICQFIVRIVGEFLEAEGG